MTRSQQDMKLALELVAKVEQDYPDPKPEGTKGRYQALCQEFPVQVRTMGLAQALAFAEAKKGAEKGLPQAYGLLLEHAAQVLQPKENLLKTIQEASTTEYIHHTCRLLEAWVFFKRFAESMLNVDKEDKNARQPF